MHLEILRNLLRLGISISFQVVFAKFIVDILDQIFDLNVFILTPLLSITLRKIHQIARQCSGHPCYHGVYS
jgi:hypothetical protein